MNWEKFSFEYHFDKTGLSRDIISIESYKEASLNLVFPKEWEHQLDRLNRVRSCSGYNSNRGQPSFRGGGF